MDNKHQSYKKGLPLMRQTVAGIAYYPDIPIDKSYKIDYLAMSADNKKAILVELKTEGMSRRESQDKYLRAACGAGFSALLGGVLDIFRATNSKRKYFHLLKQLESLKLLRLPAEMATIMSRDGLQGITEASRAIELTSVPTDCTVIYVQPNGTGPDIISFQEFSAIVGEHQDPVSQRFARSCKGGGKSRPQCYRYKRLRCATKNKGMIAASTGFCAL